MEVLVVKTAPNKKYLLIDPELPSFFVLKDFIGRNITPLGELPGYDTEKVAAALGLSPKTYEIDRKGIPKYSVGCIEVEEQQLKALANSQKDKFLTEIRGRTLDVEKINSTLKNLENKTLG